MSLDFSAHDLGAEIFIFGAVFFLRLETFFEIKPDFILFLYIRVTSSINDHYILNFRHHTLDIRWSDTPGLNF